MNSPELGELGQGQGLGEEGENITHTHTELGMVIFRTILSLERNQGNKTVQYGLGA